MSKLFLLNLAVTTRLPSTYTVGRGCTAGDTGGTKDVWSRR